MHATHAGINFFYYAKFYISTPPIEAACMYTAVWCVGGREGGPLNNREGGREGGKEGGRITL